MSVAEPAVAEGFWRAGRVGLVAAILAIGNVAIAAGVLWMVYRPGGPGTLMDFGAFWGAAHLALEGRAATAYDPAAMQAVQSEALGRPYERLMSWFYPPHLQMVLTPLGALPLLPAQAIWTLATAIGYGVVVWRILPRWEAVAAAFAPATAVLLLVNGQTGFLTAALLGLMLLALENGRRGWMAGIALGLLSIKPQVALAAPLALLAAKRWGVLAVAAAVALGAAGLATVLLGWSAWEGFFAALGQSSRDLVSNDIWKIHASLHGFLRGLGAPGTAAIGVQALLSLAVLFALLGVWARGRGSADERAALLAFACVAASPRVMDYDLLILVVGGLFQVRAMLGREARVWEAPLLALAVVLPMADFLTPLEVNWALGPVLFASAYLAMPRAA
ncbi:MAG: glycosyltransferase family 87 protein [Pseudomonadota bacterium]